GSVALYLMYSINSGGYEILGNEYRCERGVEGHVLDADVTRVVLPGSPEAHLDLREGLPRALGACHHAQRRFGPMGDQQIPERLGRQESRVIRRFCVGQPLGEVAESLP